jgi:hypothetical protein
MPVAPIRPLKTNRRFSIPTYYRVDDANVAWRVADDEAVVLHADSSAYFGLNPAATLLWAQLAKKPMTVEELATFARGAFPDAPSTLDGAISSFIESLQARALVLPESERGEGQPILDEHILSGGSPRWQTPELDGFGELEKLILSGE